jgi:hypothetical protein
LEKYLEITGNVLPALELHERSLQVRILHILVILKVKTCFNQQAVEVIVVDPDPDPTRIRKNISGSANGSEPLTKKFV